MPESPNKQLVARIFAEMSRGNVAAFGAAMADEVSWTFPGDWSWAGTWEPKTVVLEQLLRPLMAQHSEYRCIADAIHADGDHVIVQAHAQATTRAGEPYPQRYCYLLRLANDTITEITEYCDTALVERVLIRPSEPTRR